MDYNKGIGLIGFIITAGISLLEKDVLYVVLGYLFLLHCYLDRGK